MEVSFFYHSPGFSGLGSCGNPTVSGTQAPSLLMLHHTRGSALLCFNGSKPSCLYSSQWKWASGRADVFFFPSGGTSRKLHTPFLLTPHGSEHSCKGGWEMGFLAASFRCYIEIGRRLGVSAPQHGGEKKVQGGLRSL